LKFVLTYESPDLDLEQAMAHFDAHRARLEPIKSGGMRGREHATTGASGVPSGAVAIARG
jgi:hypothetical protein